MIIILSHILMQIVTQEVILTMMYMYFWYISFYKLFNCINL